MRPFLFGLVVSLFIQFHIAQKLELISSEEDVASDTSVTINGVVDELAPDYTEYFNQLEEAKNAFEEAIDIFNDEEYIEKKDNWFLADWNSDGDNVYAKDTRNGRLFAVTTEMPLSPINMKKEAWDGLTNLTKWNHNIEFANVLVAPTDRFEIVTYGSNDVLVVSGREFLAARVWRKVGDSYVIASRSVDIEKFADTRGKIRGHIYLNALRYRPHPTKANYTSVDILSLVDMKGYIPKFLLNRTIPRIILKDTVVNREYLHRMNREN